MKIVYSAIISVFLLLNSLPMLLCNIDLEVDCAETVTNPKMRTNDEMMDQNDQMTPEDHCNTPPAETKILDCCDDELAVSRLLNLNFENTYTPSFIETSRIPHDIKKSKNHFMVRKTFHIPGPPPLDKRLFLC